MCVCVCAWSTAHCLNASKRSEGLAAESQGLRRQEIKHEMKTSFSLNILPSHFPISPLPLGDFKGRREERDMERRANNWEAGFHRKGWENDKEIRTSGGGKWSYNDASQL